MPRPTLYLASASPRRRRLLAEAGIPFLPHVVPVDEDALSETYTGPLGQLGEYLARRKAIAALDDRQLAGEVGLVLAADTTVLIDGRSLAKPRDLAEAEQMLRTLRGREHIVATGIALAGPEHRRIVSATSSTRVLMRRYSDAELAAYVATGDPLDKAGAYSIQHPDFHPVASISGCHLGVIGLPMCLVMALLRGAPLPPDTPRHDGICHWSDVCAPPFPGSGAIHETFRDDPQYD